MPLQSGGERAPGPPVTPVPRTRCLIVGVVEVDPRHRDREGQSYLHLVAQCPGEDWEGHVALARLLLEWGAPLAMAPGTRDGVAADVTLTKVHTHTHALL